MKQTQCSIKSVFGRETRWSAVLAVLCLASIISPVLNAAGKKDAQQRPLVMGFVPQVDSDKLVDSVKPMETMLAKALDKPVKAFTATNYVGVVEALGSGEVDFAIISPFAYALARKEYHARVILKAINKAGASSYWSEIIVRNDSGIDSLEQLRGKRVAFVDPSSTSGYIFPAALLVEKGYQLDKDFKTLFSGGHDKSLQLLLNGDVDVVGVFNGARDRFKKEFPALPEQTKIIARTKDIPYICVIVKPNMDPAQEQTLKQVMKQTFNQGEGLELIKKLFSLYGFADAVEQDYEVIVQTAKSMNIDLKKE